MRHGDRVRDSIWWLARSAAMVPDGDDWLTPAERAYADRQRFTKRRSEFRIARYAAKSALAHVLALPSDAASLARLEIRHEPSGAPYPCVDGHPAACQLSLTDRADWAVCLVGGAAARIGCDLELVEPRSAAFVEDYFTAAEQQYVAAADSPELAANLIWSAKESALKVLTTGLRRDTRTVEVAADRAGDGWRRLKITAAEGTTYPGWWHRYGEFVLTIAAAAPVEPPVALDPWPLLGTAEPTHGWLREPAAPGA
jgi:4'-phosphopantetheinyl transferase